MLHRSNHRSRHRLRYGAVLALAAVFVASCVPPSDVEPGTTTTTVPSNPVPVSGVQLSWTFNEYSKFGAVGPWRMWTTGDEVSLGITPSDAVGSATPGLAYDDVRFDGGAGVLDPATGEASISWDTGDFVINAYPPGFGAPDETFTDPILDIDRDGSGTLSFDVSMPAGTDMAGNPTEAVGPARVVVATFDHVDALGASSLAITPDFAGRTYTEPQSGEQSLSCDGSGGSWPKEFIDFVALAVRQHYYTTSCGGLNELKKPTPFTITWEPMPVTFTRQPTVTTPLLADASYNMAVGYTANPSPTVRWQLSTDGTTWTDIADSALTRYPHRSRMTDDHASFRAVVTDAAGVEHTSAATAPVDVTGTILAIPDTFQPQDTYAYSGANVTLSVTATGSPSGTAQWQRSNDGGVTWADIEGTTTPGNDRTNSSTTLPNVQMSDSGAKFRVRLNNGNNTPADLYSKVATLTVLERIEGQRQLAVFPTTIDTSNQTAIKIVGAGFEPGAAQGNLTIALTDTTRWQPGQNSSIAGALRSVSVTKNRIVNAGGRINAELVVPVGQTFDASKSYGIALMGQTTTDRYYDTWIPVTLTSSTP